MPRAKVSDLIELEYETLGNPTDPPLLLVMGFTAQMIQWPDGFVRELVSRGLHVIRFDNRDCGLSTHLDGVDARLGAVQAAAASGAEMPAVPYKLIDMADDAFGLLDHLGIERAHIAGASMGGMIVQTMAIARPGRVASMTSIMSSTGERNYGQAAPEAMAALMTPPPAERQAFIDHTVRSARIYSSKTLFDADDVAARAARSYDRAFYPEGAARQMAAIIASRNRRDGLSTLAVPTLVIHGTDDTLILPSGGERTAELVPGATLLMVEHMGHDQPAPLWPRLADAIASHVRANA